MKKRLDSSVSDQLDSTARFLTLLFTVSFALCCNAIAPADPSDADPGDADVEDDADQDQDSSEEDADSDGDAETAADAESEQDADTPTEAPSVTYAKSTWLLIRGHVAAIPAPATSGFTDAARFQATLPTGLELDELTGAISGTPEELATSGADITITLSEDDRSSDTLITLRIYDGFVVDTVADVPDDDTSDDLCSTSAGDCSLRAAVEQANAMPGAQGILVPNGTYDLNHPTLEDRSLRLTSDIVIHGESTTGVRIDGNATSRIFETSGDFVELAYLTIRNGRTTETTPNRYGAGILVTSNTRLLISHCLIAGNSALENGGGLFINTTSDVTILDSEFRGNSSQTENGGAIDFYGGTLNIERSLFVDNEAVYGSVIRHTSGDPVTIRSSTMVENTAAIGTIACDTWTLTAPLTLTNVTIVNNEATDLCGGIYIHANDNNVILASSILAGNTASGEPENCYSSNEGFVTSLGFNIISDDAAGCADTSSFNEDDLLETDPLLEAELTDHGGPTRVLSPRAASPAVDGVGSSGECTTFDQTGAARPFDGDGDGDAACDIGAYELPPPP